MQIKIGAGTSWIARRCAITACVCIVAVSCNGIGSQPYPSECPSTVCETLTDTSAGQLFLFVELSDDGTIPSMTSIRVEFGAGSEPPLGGKAVDFVAGEQVSCDGVAFTRFPAAFGRDVLTTSISGRTVPCVYRSSQSSTPFGFSVPDHLEILTPVEHESVPRGPRTNITYKNRVAHNGLLVIATSGSSPRSEAHPDAITMTSAIVDTSSLQRGAGLIEVVEPVFPIDVQGGQFQSVGGQEGESATVDVMWV